MTQRSGQGKALRTAMRGELMVRRRRNRRNFNADLGSFWKLHCARAPPEAHKKKPPSVNSGGFSAAKLQEAN
jgi:hypothetical protein